MNSGKARDKRKQASKKGQEQNFDASPGKDGASQLMSGQRPKSVQDTQVWKGGSRNIKRLWSGYLDTLKQSFYNMPRAGQLELIYKGSIVITMGVAVVSLGLFYYFLPTIVRVFALPVVGVTAWFTATKLVAPIITARMEQYLNPE